MKNEPRLLFDLSAYGADVFFNPEFTEVDRILDVRIVPKEPMEEIDVTNNPDIDALLPSTELGEHGKFIKEFRVKWKGLQYKDLSWESFDDFQDRAAIDLYYDHLWARGGGVMSRNRDISAQVNPPDWRPSITAYRKLVESTVYKNNNVLRSYQIEGINWMLWNWVNRRNSMLADEMGLGKTVQSTMFVFNILRQYKVTPPFLVVRGRQRVVKSRWPLSPRCRTGRRRFVAGRTCTWWCCTARWSHARTSSSMSGARRRASSTCCSPRTRSPSSKPACCPPFPGQDWWWTRRTD